MIWFAFGSLVCIEALVFFTLGIAALWAAIHYTLGAHPYGYSGYGDISVFLFFGLATTMGGYFLCTRDLALLNALLPASAIGLFCVGVLNVNNIRDAKADAATRRTVAIRLGEKRSRIYHTALIFLGWACIIAWSITTAQSWTDWLYLSTLPLFIIHLRGVWTRTGRSLDKMLPLLVISTFLLAILTLL